MSVVVVNLDPSWRFASLVRQHAADLFGDAHEIAFWQALEPEPSDDQRSLWGDWPRQLLGSRAVLESELSARLATASSSPTAFVFVFPSAGSLRASEIGSQGLDVLERLKREIGSETLRASRVLRLVLFRCRPQTHDHGWRGDEIAAARQVVKDKLVDNAWFLSPPNGVHDSGDFAAVRILVELLAGRENDLAAIRPIALDRKDSVAWLRSFDGEPPNRLERVRVHYTAIVDELTKPSTNIGSVEDPSDTNKLDKNVDSVLEKIVYKPPQGAATPELGWSRKDNGLLKDVPRYFAPDLADRLAEEGARYVDGIQASIAERYKELAERRQQSLASHMQEENSVVEDIADLRTSHLGQDQAALKMIEDNRQKVHGKADSIRRELVELREEIAQTALPVQAEATSALTILQRLDEYNQLQSAVREVKILAGHLARRPVILGLSAALAIVGFGQPFLFHLGRQHALGAFAPDTSLLAHVVRALPVSLENGLTTWPLAHWVFALTVLLAGVVLYWIEVLRPQRRLQTHATKLLESAGKLSERAHAALGSSLAYAERGYRLGWCVLLENKLEALKVEVERQRSFYDAFNDLRCIGVTDPTEMDWYRRTFSPILRARPRHNWLEFLLFNWPKIDPVTVDIAGDRRLQVETRYLLDASEHEEEELSLLSIGMSDPPTHGATDGSR